MSRRFITLAAIRNSIEGVTIDMGPGHLFPDEQLFERLRALGEPVAELADGESLIKCPHCKMSFKDPHVVKVEPEKVEPDGSDEGPNTSKTERPKLGLKKAS